ncbi:hypothetical protein NQZ68_007444 [Dissostichus eleginoides]|nr:hypothetical protein NQZ68_007444 [Dissostichus eleginoides]
MYAIVKEQGTDNTGRADCSFTFSLDEMGTRIDDLESDVSELMTQAGMEEQATSCHVTSKN